MLSVTKILKMLPLVGALLITNLPTLHAQNVSIGASTVTDVVATQYIQPSGNLYTDGTTKLLCVKTNSKRYALWNPIDESLGNVSDNKNCNPPPSFHAMFALVEPEGFVSTTYLQNSSGFGGGQTIHTTRDAKDPHCVPSIDLYYTTANGVGLQKQFYVIRKLKAPKRVVYDRCEATDGKEPIRVTENYETSLIQSVDLGNGQTLIYDYAGASGFYPLLLVIKDFPDKIWSSNGTVFLVPKSILFPALLQAGWNPAARYAALTKIITPTSQP